MACSRNLTIVDFAQAAGAANRILSLRTPKDVVPRKYEGLPDAEGGVGIEFQNVYFTYEGRETSVLSNLNLKVSLPRSLYV